MAGGSVHLIFHRGGYPEPDLPWGFGRKDRRFGSQAFLVGWGLLVGRGRWRLEVIRSGADPPGGWSRFVAGEAARGEQGRRSASENAADDLAESEKEAPREHNIGTYHPFAGGARLADQLS